LGIAQAGEPLSGGLRQEKSDQLLSGERRKVCNARRELSMSVVPQVD